MAEHLLDTSIVARLVNPNDSQHAIAVDAVRKLELQGHEPVLCTQVLIEFWSVATRPTEVNGLGWTLDQAALEVADLSSRFRILAETADLFHTWFDLVQRYHVVGKRVHDMRLAALMIELGVKSLLTFNVDDFKAVVEITPIHPGDV